MRFWAMGIHPRTLYQLRDSWGLEQFSRGVYQLMGRRPLEYPDLIAVVKRVPNAVLYLISALSFHEMTTQVPHAVSIALEKGAEQPRIAVSNSVTGSEWMLFSKRSNGISRESTRICMH